MRKLDLGPIRVEVLRDLPTLLGEESLSHLQSLTIPYFDPSQFHIFRTMTSLRQLICLRGSRVVEPFTLGGAPLLPSLESISAHVRWIRALTTGHQVTQISAVQDTLWAAPIDWGDFGPQFGSDAMVRTVEWTGCSEPELLLDYLVASNPGVWHLDIKPLREDPIFFKVKFGVSILV